MTFYQKRYIALKDSVFSRQLTKNLMKVEAEHFEKENQNRIDAQNKILPWDQEIIQRQKYLNIFIGIVAVLLVAFVFLLVKSNRQKQRVNVLLDRKVAERTRELQLNRDTLRRECEERDLIIDKASKDIKTSFLTLKGLCTIGLKDVKDPKALEYISMMDVATQGLSTILRQLYINKRVNRDVSLTTQ